MFEVLVKKPSVETSILDRLEQVFFADLIRLVEIGDGSGYFEDAIVCASGQVELFHR